MSNGLALLSAAVLLAALSGCAARAPSHGDWVGHWDRGLQATDRRDYETAIREITKSIELIRPDESKDMFVSRGDAYVGQGNYEQAIADYTRAIQLSKRSAAEIMGGDYGSRTRTYDLAPIYEKLAAAYGALAVKSRGR